MIDGGKGQLHSAVNSLKKLDLYGKVPILGLAKQMEEIYFPEDKDPYLLAKNSMALKTLMHIRDEAHRFGITFHRKLREKSQINSILGDIKSIGEATETILLHEFKSVSNIKQKSIEELAKVIGKKKAQLIHEYLIRVYPKECRGKSAALKLNMYCFNTDWRICSSDRKYKL